MNRRQTLKGLAVMAGGELIAPALLTDFFRTAAAITTDRKPWKPRWLPARHATLLAELCEVILPTTDTPGAKDALVHVFIDLYVKDCYLKAQQEIFLAGLDQIDIHSQQQAGKAFLQLSKEQRLGLLQQLEKASWAKGEKVEQSFIKMLKNLTLLGFFSSQAGATKAAEYQASPGPFQGCIELKPGQKAQAL